MPTFERRQDELLPSPDHEEFEECWLPSIACVGVNSTHIQIKHRHSLATMIGRGLGPPWHAGDTCEPDGNSVLKQRVVLDIMREGIFAAVDPCL